MRRREHTPQSTFKVISTGGYQGWGYNPNSTYASLPTTSVGRRSRTTNRIPVRFDRSCLRAVGVIRDTVFYKLANEMWLKDGGLNPSRSPGRSHVHRGP